MNRFGFHIDMAAIKLEALIVAQPVKHRVAFFNFQRCPEDRFVRHFGVMHLNGQPAVLNAALQLAAEVFSPRQQFPLFPGQIFPRRLEAGFLGCLQRDIQREGVNFPTWLRCQPNVTQIRRELRCHGAQPFNGRQIEMRGADTQLIATLIIRAADILLRHPCQRQRAARPGFAVHGDARIRDGKLPAPFLFRHMCGEVIYRELMLLAFALPACTALLQPDIAAGEHAFRQGHPAFQAKTGRFQLHVLLQPVAEPRLHIHVVSL